MAISFVARFAGGARAVAMNLSFMLPATSLLLLCLSFPAFAQIETELFFESPAEGALVSQRDPAVRLRLRNFSGSGSGSEKLTINVDGQDSSICNLGVESGVAHCPLKEELSDGWRTINAELLSGEIIIAQAAVVVAVDSDEDGIPNHEDSCASTPLQESVDGAGCALSQLDSDGDGISDAEEVAAGSDPADASSFPQVEIQAFSALPEQVVRVGDSVGLSWSIQGASSVTLTNDANETRLVALSSVGAAQVSPRINTTYSLTAEGPGGNASAQVQVKVHSKQPENLWGVSPIDQVPEPIGASLTVAGDGAVYLGAFDGNYYRFFPDGSLDWTLGNAGIAMNQAAVADSRIFVGTNDADGGRVLALKADKSLSWKVHTASGVIASPVLNADASRLYVAGYDGTVLGLSLADGSVQWRHELPEGETVSAAPTISEDGTVLYVHTNNHQVFALEIPQLPQTMSTTGAGITKPKSSTVIWQKDIRPASQ
ncbi:PQQ-binding-like beta-propeller repeat protein [Microbulbifer halophilus]|uniref:PQQ-binding-like beta-propeller repeat protein n=1 Tax=Microbulbifer halophilus TaxID=453963 RepID=A0ABW5EDD5_9GAMM|nr:PQQ-binding-like beta-propeller repeat protein [Microbulbifer halophilus]MCW8126991.1 PQQ-binding-like beta-propeller repeat protein [Microbulbifer halophilus]